MLISERIFRSGSRRIPGSTYLPILLILVTRLASWVAFPQPRLSPDSVSYSTSGWLDFSLVSFSGSASRGWPAPFFFALFPTDSFRILAQLLLATSAYAFLIHSTTYVLHGRKARWFFSLVVVLVATSPQVLQWDSTILGTSIMITSFVFLAGALIRIVNSSKFDNRFIFFSIGIILLLSFQKISNLILVLPIAGILIYLKFETLRKSFKIYLVAVLLLITPLAFISSINQEKYWKGSYSGTTLLWQLGDQSPAASNFAEFLSEKTEAPECIYDTAPYKDLNQGIHNALNICPGGEEYVRNNLKNDFAHFISTNPKSALNLILLGVGATVTGSSGNYGNAVTVFPKFVYSILWGEVSPDFRSFNELDQSEIYNNLNTGEPLFLYCPLFMFLGVGFYVAISRRYSKLDQAKSKLFLAFCILALAQAIFSYLMLPSEWFRQSVPYLIFGLVINAYIIAKKVLED
jgi:hypothetical protein